MSTYVYLVCADHEPPLHAEDESGQHLSDLPRIRAELADREVVSAEPGHYSPYRDPYDMDAYFRAHSARFLAAHPKCRIGIWDERGTEHTTEVTP